MILSFTNKTFGWFCQSSRTCSTNFFSREKVHSILENIKCSTYYGDTITLMVPTGVPVLWYAFTGGPWNTILEIPHVIATDWQVNDDQQLLLFLNHLLTLFMYHPSFTHQSAAWKKMVCPSNACQLCAVLLKSAFKKIKTFCAFESFSQLCPRI